MVEDFVEPLTKPRLLKPVEFRTTIDGRRQIWRYVAELDADDVQDLPPENLRRFAFKMATGSGKTWVMAMLIVWAYFHKKRVVGSDLSTNFLIVAPNIIVYQRLEKDFASNQIFYDLPLVPPEWGPLSQKVILRGENTQPDPSGNLFLTNVQQLYEARDQAWTPQNAIDALLGPRPSKDLASYGPSMLDRLKGLRDLVVLNDEAHHVHDEDLAWSQSLLAIHRALPQGLSLWLDFSATPKYQDSGTYFPWTICDYPLAQAVEDRITKAPIIVTKDDDPKQPEKDPENLTKDNVCEKCAYWIQAAVHRWKDHWKTYSKLGTKPVLFIMAEKNVYADVIGEYLWNTKEFGFKQSEMLVIHTDAAGEITKTDLDKAREVARDIDKPANKIKVIVSVMMLREGWDVRNVSVVLGLRPFTAKAEILPEQVIGRGLRLMIGIGPDRTQTLEVLGTRNLLKVLREQLEQGGVALPGPDVPPPPRPVIIEPMLARAKHDIAIPITKPCLTHNTRKLSTLDPNTFGAIYDQNDLDEIVRIHLRMEFAPTETEVHQDDVPLAAIPIAQELLASITNKVMDRAKLPNVFSELYPIVRTYVAKKCFGKEVDVDTEQVRSHLHQLTLKEGIAKYLARKISALTVEKGVLEFERADFTLSGTQPFSWRRNLPPLEADHTIFNYVATYNNFERQFAEFLDHASDVVRFASLGTTEQGDSCTEFKIDYLKPSGAIGFYHPDWVAVQKTSAGEVNWILETKGRAWEDTAAKEAAMHEWCARVSEQTGQMWRHARINQVEFDMLKPKTLQQATTAGMRPQTSSKTLL